MPVYGSVLYGGATYGASATTGAGGPFTSLGIVSTHSASDVWLIDSVVPLSWSVTDRDGEPADPTSIVLTITLEGGTPETLTTSSTGTGELLAAYRPTVPGPYTVRLVLNGDRAGAAVDRFLVVPADPWALTVSAMRAYLVDTSATDGEITDALTAERYAQAARCRIDRYTPDLLQALKRRVARNLAARRVPVATLTQFDGGQTSTRLPRTDAEVARLEAPYRRMSVG